MRASSLVTGAFLLFAGCIARPVGSPNPATEATRHAVVVDPRAGSGEPSLAVGRDALYVIMTGAQQDGDPAFASSDHAATWRSVGPLNARFSGSDADIAVAADGTVYAAGNSIACTTVAVSRDEGRSWKSNPVACGDAPNDDRPWLATDTPGVVYAGFRCYDGGFRQGHVCVARSKDSGATWESPVVVGTSAGFPGNLAVDHGSHAIYFSYGGTVGPIAPADGLANGDNAFLVASSRDNGTTWTEHVVAKLRGARDGPDERNVHIDHMSLAVDDVGNVYAAWGESISGSFDVYASFSTDHGATWSPPVRVNAHAGAAVWPWIAARGDGDVAVAWEWTTATGDPGKVPAGTNWWIEMSRSRNGHGPQATWNETAMSDHANHNGPICLALFACNVMGESEARRLQDFFGEIAFDASGRICAVWANDVDYATAGHAVDEALCLPPDA